MSIRFLSLFLMMLLGYSVVVAGARLSAPVSQLLPTDTSIPAGWKHTHRSKIPREKEWLPEQIDLFFSHESVQDLPYDLVSFATFLKRTGFYTDKIQLRFNPHSGFYIVAADKVSLSDELLSAGPLSFLHENSPLLTPLTKSRLTALRSLFDCPGLEGTLEDTSRLAMTLTLLSECTDPESAWASYFPFLQTITLPFMLSSEQQKELNLDNRGGFQVNNLKPLFTSLKLVMEHDDFAFVKENEALLNWAIATVTSRSFSWGPDARKHMMVPALDMINHDSYYINRYEYSETQDLRYLSSRELQPEEEIHIAYRPYAMNSHLLQLYGFSIPRLQEDFVLMRMSTGMVEKLTSIMQTYLENNNFILHTDVSVNAVVGYDDHIPTALVRAVDIVLGGLGTPSRQAFEFILEAIEADLNSFGTTVEQEEERLQKAILGNGGNATVTVDNNDNNNTACDVNSQSNHALSSKTKTVPTGFADHASALIAMYRREAIRLLSDIKQGFEEDMSVCMCSLDPEGFAAELALAEAAMNEAAAVNTNSGEVMEAQVDAVGNVSVASDDAQAKSKTRATSVLGSTECDECVVTSKRTLKQTIDERALRVLVIGLQYGDDTSTDPSRYEPLQDEAN